MSAYRYLTFVIGIPFLAILLSVVYEFIWPAIDIMNQFSNSTASSTGIQWYTDFVNWLPAVVLALLAFTLIVAVVVRRGRVTGGF